MRLEYFTSLVTQDLYASLSTNNVSDLDDVNLNITDGFLVPLLTDLEIPSGTLQRAPRVGENLTGASLTLLVCKTVPLDGKQRLVIQKILSQVVGYLNSPSGISHHNKSVVYIGGEGDVGQFSPV